MTLNKWIKKYPQVSDIFLFGSAVRGKQKPQDTDILILFKDKVDKNIEYSIRKVLEKRYPSLSLLSKTEKAAVEESFDARESILFEGKSLISGKKFADRYGFQSFGLFKYDFGSWSKLQKTKFYHALNGRAGRRGMADILECIKIFDSALLVHLEKIELLKEFLDAWHLRYRYIPLLIPKRLGRKKILE